MSRNRHTESTLGPRIRALRLGRGLSLAALAQSIGLSEATLSRIETGQSPVSAPHLYGLAQELEVDLSAFFADDITALHPGFRALTRAGEGEGFATPRLSARLQAGELLRKRMHPIVNRVSAMTLDKVGGLRAHGGEEYLHILAGPLVFHAAGYAPLTLQTGDSLYFDARIPHAYLAAKPEGAEFLVVSTTEAPDDIRKDL